LLAEPVPAVQWYALDALAALKDPAAVPDLRVFAYRLAAARRSRSIEDMLAEPEIVLANLSLETRALALLAELDAPAALDLLLDATEPVSVPRNSGAGLALANGFYQLRRTALYGLAYTRAPEQAGELLLGAAGLGDPDPRLRAVALRSLAVLGAPGAVETALASLSDDAPEPRWTAAMALGRLADPRAEGPLIGALADPHGEVRRQAAASLGFLGAVAAKPALELLAAGDPRASVRAEAAATLRLLAGG
jgi:HEAT repeat protein